jgi:hypothetical protein
LDSFVPAEVGGVYHVDEMLLHVRKEKNVPIENDDPNAKLKRRKFGSHYSWLWNLMETRFWICSRISQRRDIDTARKVFQDMKQRAPLPKVVVHDGLNSYRQAFRKELGSHTQPRIQAVRSISVRKEGLNERVERLNGTVRDREITMRGMDTAKTTQELMEAMRIHFNFIRPSMALGGLTPAQASGINLPLEEKKVENLIRQAAVSSKTEQHPLPVKGLGIRANKVDFIYEPDCIKIKTKTWLELKEWREIHEIVRIQGFVWIPKGKDSCWMKMLSSDKSY